MLVFPLKHRRTPLHYGHRPLDIDGLLLVKVQLVQGKSFYPQDNDLDFYIWFYLIGGWRTVHNFL